MITASHLHAMVVHFPIALLIVGFLSAVIALFNKNPFFNLAAFYLLLLGTAGAITAYTADKAADEGMEGGTLGKAMELHEQAATIALWLTCITAVFYLAVAVFKYKKGWVKFARIILFAVTQNSTR